MEKDPRDVIIRPVITEHSYDAMENNVYTFEVAKDANKVAGPVPGHRGYLQGEGGQGEHAEREVEAEARSLPGRSHAHLEEGHGHPG